VGPYGQKMRDKKTKIRETHEGGHTSRKGDESKKGWTGAKVISGIRGGTPDSKRKNPEKRSKTS